MRDRSDMMPLVVSDIRHQTPAIVSVHLAHPDGEDLPVWEPGAHVDLQLITRQERQYSLCGDPADPTSYRIGVLREPLSRGGSHYIHSHLRTGRRVWVRPPRNLFPLETAPAYVLLAAGIGITPLLAMARRLEATGADWRLVYLTRDAGDVAFADELAAYGDRVRLHLSRTAGRLDLRAALASLPAGTAVYACGPQPFADALDDLRDALPTGAELHMERFAPAPRVFGSNQPFTVVAERSQVEVAVPAEWSMLQALRGAGIDAPGSCLRGVCGSCVLRVTAGSPEHRDSLGTTGEARMHPCVSRSIGPRLSVDI
ncbi:PDR/VanB family oxidoreductase [Microbacterium sp. cf332]|uniref:PDR/VanB family oxidoreductase n=1 Tax=Microbacterium sp. cf332 TaxID=1761804 RepID=UPI0008857C4A|nr:PDR/VanB family oxidoreductase [Microbacterium sp. cf332]SDQ13816.1 Ferredoxin-NADP reductase [Microbacterium sp. cf332]